MRPPSSQSLTSLGDLDFPCLFYTPPPPPLNTELTSQLKLRLHIRHQNNNTPPFLCRTFFADKRVHHAATSQTPWQGMCEERFEKSPVSMLTSTFPCVSGEKTNVTNDLDNIIQCCVGGTTSVCLENSNRINWFINWYLVKTAGSYMQFQKNTKNYRQHKCAWQYMQVTCYHTWHATA